MELSPETVRSTLDAVGVRWPQAVVERLSAQIASPMSYTSMDEVIRAALEESLVRASEDQIDRTTTALVDALREAQPRGPTRYDIPDRGTWEGLTDDQRAALMAMENLTTRSLRLVGVLWLLVAFVFLAISLQEGFGGIGGTLFAVSVYLAGITLLIRAAIGAAQARRARHLLGDRSLIQRMRVVAARGWVEPPKDRGRERTIWRITRHAYTATVVVAVLSQLAAGL